MQETPVFDVIKGSGDALNGILITASLILYLLASLQRENRGSQYTRSGMEVPRIMLLFHWNWQKLFSYGEVFCFASAWAVGLLIAMQEHSPDEDRATRSYAAATDELGVQARMTR